MFRTYTVGGTVGVTVGVTVGFIVGVGFPVGVADGVAGTGGFGLTGVTLTVTFLVKFNWT